MVPKTHEEVAYEKLKELILFGELPKDKFLSQRMLAQRVDSNITTVRTALRQLENDGLIENVPQWGVRIPIETEERLLDLYFFRELLEVGAVRRLVQRRNQIDNTKIIEKAKHCDALARKLPEAPGFSQAHYDFHMELARQSGSPLLVQALNRIHFRGWLLRHDRRLLGRRNLVNHTKLVSVILNSDEEAAVEAIRKHIFGGLQLELRELAESANSTTD